MAKADFETARKQTKCQLEKYRVQAHMFYAPATGKYWPASLRVLVVNMESYGYEAEGWIDVGCEPLKQWLGPSVPAVMRGHTDNNCPRRRVEYRHGKPGNHSPWHLFRHAWRNATGMAGAAAGGGASCRRYL